MHPMILLFASLVLISAAHEPAPLNVLKPPPAIAEQKKPVLSQQECRDRMTLVRGATGKPQLLHRGPASPDDTYLVYAVDQRVDGCSVMVIKGDVHDIRPLPKPSTGPMRLIPLNPTE